MLTLYWIYRGLRRGLYPALNMFLVFFLSLLVTLNYYDVLMDVVGRIAPKSDNTIREAISLIAMYLVMFTFFLYFCLWLCAETMRLHKSVDLVGGGIFGAAAGTVMSGVLLMFWFSMPFSRKFPVDDAEMFFPAQKYTVGMATAGAAMVKGPRPFRGEGFLRDMRYGLPDIPSIGSGYYIASIPNGLRVFIDARSGTATPSAIKIFMEDIRRRLAYPDKEVPPSEKALPWGDRGRTPIFLGDQAAGALVAVIMDQIPPEIGASLSEQKLFENDGEMYFSKERIGTQTLYVKIYEVKREGNIATLIALFQPTDSRQVGLVRGFLPTKICYPFDETGMVMDLIRRGLPDDQARPFLPQLLQGGKIYFTGGQGKPVVVEMTGVNRWKSFEPPRVDPAVVNSASVPIYR